MDQPEDAKRARAARQILRACFVLMWVGVLVLALEGGQAWWRATGVKRFHDMAMRRVTPQNAVPARPGPSLGGSQDHPCTAAAAASESGSIPLWKTPFGLGSNPAERSQRHALFVTLNEADRALFALVNNELVFQMDERGGFSRAYGNGFLIPLFTSNAATALRASFEDMRAGKQAPGLITFSVEAEGNRVEVPFSVDFEPKPSDAASRAGEYAFIPTEPIVKRLMTLAIPPDHPESSRWEIPFLKYRPNLRGDCPTNNIGFYGEDVHLPKPPGVFRIVCIGGSTTEEREFVAHSYPSTLQDHFNADFGQGAVEVVNCGTPAISTFGHLLRMPDYLRLQPDLVVLYLGVNDTNMMFSLPGLIGATPFQHFLAHSSFVRFWLGGLLSPGETALDETQRKTTIANLEAMVRAFQEHGASIALCSFAYPSPAREDLKERLYYSIDAETQWNAPCLRAYLDAIDGMNRAYRRLCETMGMQYVPVAEHIDGNPAWFLDLCHMNDLGSREKADVIYRYIRSCVASAVTR